MIIRRVFTIVEMAPRDVFTMWYVMSSSNPCVTDVFTDSFRVNMTDRKGGLKEWVGEQTEELSTRKRKKNGVDYTNMDFFPVLGGGRRLLLAEPLLWEPSERKRFLCENGHEVTGEGDSFFVLPMCFWNVRERKLRAFWAPVNGGE